MTQHYLLRNFDRAIWRQFKARCAAEGVTMNAALTALIEAYLSGRVEVAAVYRADEPEPAVREVQP